MNQKKMMMMSTAIAGLMTAGVALSVSNASAAEATGHCMGANACKGQSGCAVKGQNECKGHNNCKGKGFIETTKAQCERISKKDKNIKFES